MVEVERNQCRCGGQATVAPPVLERESFVTGSVAADGRAVPVVATRLSRADRIGRLKVRLDVGRGRYAVRPGLYAAGAPTPESPVLVTANYKLSFDALRQELPGIDAWILVLDTKGINVWCAAGKGTFGTEELVARAAEVGLHQVVSHRRLILPQLAAPGVSAPAVQRLSDWRVVYGPVRAADIPAWLAAGMRKTEAMRAVRFRLRDRMTIAPVELRHALPVLLALLAFSALGALPFAAGYLPRVLNVFVPYLGAVLVGTLAFPALLPLLPFRAFASKGAVLGVLWGVGASLLVRASLPGSVAITLIVAPIVAFLAMNFTGSSTFTCQTGAELEVKRGLVPMIASLVLGAGLLAALRILGA